jgi:serine/threonine protein kinase
MSEGTIYRNSLALGSMLNEYRIESVLGAGGFGMTYLGWDANLETHVAIKEYLPTELAVRALDGSVVPVTTGHEHDYQWGLDRFILEARTLAKFSHPHIVRVNRYFEGNGTGYMVMEYERGEPFSHVLKRAAFPDEKMLTGVLLPLLDGLAAVHGMGFLHRDIKPGNIFIREGGSPVLIDFGAARQAIGTTKSLTAVLTPGYAPLEQYTNDGRQGPWSDIYALSAVMYRAITNTNPPDAVGRLRDDPVPHGLALGRAHYSEMLLQAIAWALATDEKMRPQQVAEWKAALTGEDTPPDVGLLSAVPTSIVTTVDLDAPTLPGKHRSDLPPGVRVVRPGRSPAEAPSGNWRWMIAGAAALIVVAMFSSWNKHRTLEASRDTSVAQAAVPEPPRTAAPEPAAVEAAVEQAAAAPSTPAAEPAERRRRDDVRTSAKVPVRDAIPLSPTAERERPTRERMARYESASLDAEQMRRKAAQEFQLADRNSDGFLTRDEVRERMPFVFRIFDRIDADRDGRLSQQEFARLRASQAQGNSNP